MTLRLANGGHQALCLVGVLAGFRYAHEAAADPGVAAYLTAYFDQEAAPTLEALLGRWRYPAVADTLRRIRIRIRTDCSDRPPAWLLPLVRENLAGGGPLRAATLDCAAWGGCSGLWSGREDLNLDLFPGREARCNYTTSAEPGSRSLAPTKYGPSS